MVLVHKNLRSLFNRIKLMSYSKYTWSRRTPKQKWNAIYNFTKFLANLIQIGILDDRENGPLMYAPLISGVAYYTSAIYTIYYYSMNGQFYESLSCFCMFGVLTSVRKKNTY